MIPFAVLNFACFICKKGSLCVNSVMILVVLSTVLKWQVQPQLKCTALRLCHCLCHFSGSAMKVTLTWQSKFDILLLFVHCNLIFIFLWKTNPQLMHIPIYLTLRSPGQLESFFLNILIMELKFGQTSIFSEYSLIIPKSFYGMNQMIQTKKAYF